MNQSPIINFGQALPDAELANFHGATASECTIEIIFHSDGSMSAIVPEECQDRVEVKQK